MKFGIGLAPFDRWTSYDEMADAVAAAEKADDLVVTSGRLMAVFTPMPMAPYARSMVAESPDDPI